MLSCEVQGAAGAPAHRGALVGHLGSSVLLFTSWKSCWESLSVKWHDPCFQIDSPAPWNIEQRGRMDGEVGVWLKMAGSRGEEK